MDFLKISYLLHKQHGHNLGLTRLLGRFPLRGGILFVCLKMVHAMHYINNSIPFMPHDTVAFPPLYTPSTDTYTDKHFNVYRLPADSAPPHSYQPNLKMVATAPATKYGLHYFHGPLINCHSNQVVVDL